MVAYKERFCLKVTKLCFINHENLLMRGPNNVNNLWLNTCVFYLYLFKNSKSRHHYNNDNIGYFCEKRTQFNNNIVTL